MGTNFCLQEKTFAPAGAKEKLSATQWIPACAGMTGDKSFVTPAQAEVGLNSASNASQILTCLRSGIVNFKDLIPAYAGMTKKKA